MNRLFHLTIGLLMTFSSWAQPSTPSTKKITNMENTLQRNKQVVVRFNKECIEQGKGESFDELLAEDVINHSAPAGAPKGKESFLFFINNILRKGFSEIKVEILEQVAERDLVTTRKKITARHTGDVMGIAPSNKVVEINVIDIIRLKDGKYAEHWGQSNFDQVLKQISTVDK